jgi:hypothetical protein
MTHNKSTAIVCYLTEAADKGFWPWLLHEQASLREVHVMVLLAHAKWWW